HTRFSRDGVQTCALPIWAALALPGRLLAALGRRKGGPSTPEEEAAIYAREKVLQRQALESERLALHYTAQLDAQLAAYLQAAVRSEERRAGQEWRAERDT